MATIHDVATRAGVSIKTVSRVLNGEPHVRPALRERVRAAAEALHYRPNQAARSLGGRRSFLIAYLYDNPNPAYIAGIQAGALRRCIELDYHLVVELVDGHAGGVATMVERLVTTLAPDGVVLTPPLSDNEDVLALLARTGTRTVKIASPDHGQGLHVFMDERAAARMITEHMIGLGHRAIGIIKGHPKHHAAAARYDGYADALRAAGMAVREDHVVQGYFDVQSGIDGAGAILAAADPPTAIFATNDEMALGTIIAARSRNIELPRSLSIAGFDDTPMSRMIWPSLTTIRQPLEDMGWSAVDMLIGAVAANGTREVPFELKVRESTASITEPRE